MERAQNGGLPCFEFSALPEHDLRCSGGEALSVV